MVYYGNTVRALIKAGATTVELLTQQMGSAEHTRHPLTWAGRAFLPSHPSQWHPGNGSTGKSHWNSTWCPQESCETPKCAHLLQHHGTTAGWKVKKGSLNQILRSEI